MEDRIKSFITKHNIWKVELLKLREMLIKTNLVESVKWRMPSYEINGQNVVGIGAFKNHIGLWFHQGALLSDPLGILINAQKGKTKAMRSIRISKEIPINQKVLEQYIQEAIDNALQGKKVVVAKPKKIMRDDLELADELKVAFEKDLDLEQRFYNLTPIQQYDYAEYINSAKRTTTKISRMEKILPLIKEGKPLNTLWAAK